MEKHYIDKRIYEELNELDANPPVEAWLNISEELQRRRRKRALPAFLGIAASLAALVAIAVSVWFATDLPVSEDIASGSQPAADLLPPIEPQLQGVQLPTGILAQSDPAAIPAELPLYADPTAPERVPAARLHAIAGHLTRNLSLPGIHTRGQDPGYESLAHMHHAPSIQDHNEKMSRESQGRLRLGAHFAPQQNHRLLARNSDFVTSSIPFESLEEGILTYSAGFNLTYAISQSLSIQTGLNYINTGQFVSDIHAYKHPGDIPLFEADRNSGLLVHPQTILTSQGSIRFHDPYHYFADVQSHRVITNKQSMDVGDIKSLRQTNTGLTQVFQFVELPVAFRYEVVGGFASLHVKGGLSVNYLLGNDVYAGTNIFQSSIGETYGVRKLNFAAMGGFSLDIPLAGNLRLHLEPTAQIFLNPILQEGMMMGHAYPYNYSLQTGISYGF